MSEAAKTPQEWLNGHASGIADRNGEVSALNASVRELAQTLLSEALDLCLRARKLDTQILERNMADQGWTGPRSGTPWLWVQQQYDTDLAEWEARAKKALPI